MKFICLHHNLQFLVFLLSLIHIFNALSERKKAVQIKRVEKIREVFDLDIDPAALLQQYAGKNPFPSIVHHIMEQYKDCLLYTSRCV